MSLRRSEEWPELGGHRGAKPAVGGGHLMHRVPPVDNTLSIIQHHPFTHLARGSPETTLFLEVEVELGFGCRKSSLVDARTWSRCGWTKDVLQTTGQNDHWVSGRRDVVRGEGLS